MVELNITQEKVFSLFMENQVSQAPDGKGFRVYCPIILGADASLTWHHCTLEPRGYDKWAQTAVRARCYEGTCSNEQCGHKGSVWRWQHNAAFCSQCWHRYKTKHSRASILQEKNFLEYAE